MKFFAVIATLATLAAAVPATENPHAVLITEESSSPAITARQTFPGCAGLSQGQYGCFGNISNPNDRYMYIGQCGTDGNLHVSTLNKRTR